MPEQKSSTLLTQDENDTVFSLLGFKCQTMVTTVVELYTTGGPSSGEWQLRETGVLCFVKDSAKRSYFFRLYCPVRRKLLWEHEIYNNIDYLTPTPFLHTFEAENCIAGFNFASEEEGKKVRDVLRETMESKKQRRERRNRNHSTSMAKNTHEMNGMNINMNTNPVIHEPLVKHPSKKVGKRKYTKADIGVPQDFRHVSHVGWDPNKGFDLDKGVDPQLRDFFSQAGVSETHLQDKETRDFIYDFINRNGGIEKVKEEMEPPPIPTRGRTAPPRPPVRLGPPPPPPPPLRVQPPRSLPSTPKPEVTNSVVTYNPPPPPPPPPVGPPPPPMSMPLPSVPDNPRAALMDELTRNRTQLKPLNVDSDTEDRKPPTVPSDSHGQLMDQIKEGQFKLKPVAPQPVNNNQTIKHSSELANALATALAERNKVIHSDSSSDSESDEGDDEWDD
uniref:Wiskott-aldrich syndrome protein n=1 Tax=Riptortus pedestris TaxID=329032 RepID=R4WIZ4_RIPPE|nr:wiskott-aldrich syndrome protein [Riptortus pedestris]